MNDVSAGALSVAPSSQLSMRGVISRTGWLLPDDMSYEEWEDVGRQLGKVENALQWWIGDWWVFGEHQFGRRAAMFKVDVDGTSEAERLGLPAFQTCANAGMVSFRFKDISRRREALPFTHHAEVAKLPADEADHLLDDAERYGWTTRELRAAVHRASRRAIHSEQRLGDLPEGCTIRQGSVAEVLDMPAGSVDLIVTDPPYPEEYLPLFDTLAEAAGHVLRDGGMLLCMSGQAHLPAVYRALCREPLTYRWTLAYLTPGGQATQVFPAMVNTFWKPVLLLTKGKYARDWFGDVTRSDVNDNDKRFHNWGQSESGMLDLMRRFVWPGDVVLDPFLGGGTTGAAALELGASFIGLDIDPDVVATAHARLANGGV